MDAQTRIDDLLFIVTNLNDVLQRENEALAQGHHGKAAELVEQKVMLSRAYEIRVAGMKISEEDYAEADADTIEALKAQGERLNALIETNARELEIGLETSRRFIEVLSEAVKSETPSAGTYNAGGAIGYGSGHGGRKTYASIAINKEL